MIANMTSDCSFDFKTRFGKPPAVPGRCQTAAKVTQFSSKKKRKKPFANRIREIVILKKTSGPLSEIFSIFMLAMNC